MLLYYLSLIETKEDQSKFEKLYTKYKALMKYIALLYLGNESLAEEAVHDAFIKIINNLNGIDDVYSHKTKSFIVIVIRRTSIDNGKKERKHRYINLEDASETAAVAVSSDNVPDQAEAREVLAKLKALPEKYRDILELKIYHQLPDKQIADLLNLTYPAFRKRLQRAREALNDLLNK